MARQKKGKKQVGQTGPKAPSLRIVYPEGQKYACRDCPARCCRSPWGIPVSSEECERIVSDEAASERMGGRGRAILRAGVLPMREHEGNLQCLFLDDDELCSLQKRHDHAFIPATCQAYPFGFGENEEQRPIALLSRYCPSIRDNFGDPVEAILEEKLEQAGGARPMGPKMGLQSGRVLEQKHVGLLAEAWRELLEEESSPATALVHAYQVLEALDEELPKKSDLSRAEVEMAIGQARAGEVQSLDSLARPNFNARMLHAYLLGGLCYPSRVLLAHRVVRVGLLERVRALWNRISWIFGVGRVRLYLVARPVPVGRVNRVGRFLETPLGRIVSDYLSEVLLRRQGMSKQGYLSRVIVDLGLMLVLISRFARASAASEQREVEECDVREGIALVELLFAHQGEGAESLVLQSLRMKLMSNLDDYRRLLGTEV